MRNPWSREAFLTWVNRLRRPELYAAFGWSSILPRGAQSLLKSAAVERRTVGRDIMGTVRGANSENEENILRQAIQDALAAGAPIQDADIRYTVEGDMLRRYYMYLQTHGGVPPTQPLQLYDADGDEIAAERSQIPPISWYYNYHARQSVPQYLGFGQ